MRLAQQGEPGRPSGTVVVKVAVLAGGNSAEASVSRSSAAGVAHALESCDHDVTVVEVDDALVGTLREMAPDVVFPVLHGPPGEDGTIQGLLTMLGLPFVGSDVRGCAVAMDKHVAKALFRAADLPVADDLFIEAGTPVATAKSRILAVFGSPHPGVVVKPLRQGSALGVTPLSAGEPLAESLREALAFGDGVLVERYMAGREITVGVLDEHGREPIPLPVTEVVVAAGEWYDFVNRYTPGKSEHIIPPDLPAPTLRTLQDMALRAHRCLGLRDLSRADFVVGDDVCLLEVNNLPGMTPTSLYPDACAAIGIDFGQLADRLVRSALRRGAEAV